MLGMREEHVPITPHARQLQEHLLLCMFSERKPCEALLAELSVIEIAMVVSVTTIHSHAKLIANPEDEVAWRALYRAQTFREALALSLGTRRAAPFPALWSRACD